MKRGQRIPKYGDKPEPVCACPPIDSEDAERISQDTAIRLLAALKGQPMNFEQAFEKVLGHEGGYVSDPRDPGGETKYGISKRAYPLENIAAMTIDRARELYKRDFWGPAGCDAVPDSLKLPLFDTAVNMGVRQAVKLLQRTVGATEDGILGPRTLQAISSMPVDRAASRFLGYRLQLYTDLQGWEAFGKGWARRVAQNLVAA